MSKQVTQLTPKERREQGRERRSVITRTELGEWSAPADRTDPVSLLEEGAKSRVPELVPIRHGRMLVSAFTFFRGTAEIMGADLATHPSTGMVTQLCGDAHLSNFGAFSAFDRTLVFDCNDFDETTRGPWEWDVKRLAASFEIAGRENGFGKRERREATARAVRKYCATIAELAEIGNLDLWYRRLHLDDAINEHGDAMDARVRKRYERGRAKAIAKDRFRAMEKLTERRDGKLRIVSQPPLIVPIEDIAEGRSEDEIREYIEHLLRAYRRSLPDAAGALLDQYHYVHAARKVVGVGSVGTRCWIVLLVGRDEGDPLFLQVKEAGASALAPYVARSRYRHEGRRVVEGQRIMQATGDALLGWMSAAGVDGETREFYARQLWDGKASVNVALMDPSLLGAYGELCGATLARAHARGGDRIAITGYLGKGDAFTEAMTRFASTYADQNERDFAAFQEAVDSGRLEAIRDL
ncbi:MAG: DUF2252 domain-containing protein [Solirubrobacterales bacterium]|nr:DUF2252 domain-containing protein [Solirubrobacterales bacterium]